MSSSTIVSNTNGHARLPDDFADAAGRWLWLQLVPARFKISLLSIRRWKRGCPVLGRPIKVQRLTGVVQEGGTGSKRDYVRVDDLERIIKARARVLDDQDDGWLSHERATRLLPACTLLKFSNHRTPWRTEGGEPHPALGRYIKNDVRRVPTAHGRFAYKVFYWRADIETILLEQRRPLWATWSDARADYGLSKSGVAAAIRTGRVRANHFAMVPKRGHRTVEQHVYRPDLDKLVQAREQRESAPRRGSPDRIHADEHGERWSPMEDTAAFLGVHRFFLLKWLRSCPHLEGKPLRARRFDLPLYNNRRTKPWFIHLGDRDAIHARMNSKSEPAVSSAPTPETPRQQALGPELPNKLHGPNGCAELGPIPFNLIRVLWQLPEAKRCVSLDDLSVDVWGQNGDVTTDAMKQALRRANRAIREVGLPLVIQQKSGYVLMDRQ